MNKGLEQVPDGTVTTPRGFSAGGIHVGVRTDWDKLDVGIIFSEEPCAAAATYTKNRLPGASLLVSRKHLGGGRAQAVVANAGCANAATGQQGIDDAISMAQAAGDKLRIDPHLVTVSSTGVIGTYLPMDRINAGIKKLQLSPDGGMDFAKAIMTTDTRPKHVAVRCGNWSVGGVVKGVGMIHPNMATMLCFLTTDANVSPPFLHKALRGAVNASFNVIDVDSDTSPDDIALVMANGVAGGGPIDEAHAEAPAFGAALESVCISLARQMVADAEGATTVIEARVDGARSVSDARKAAREIVRSLAVKTAIYGRDANWGRIHSAVGNSGAEVDEAKISIFFRTPAGTEICLLRDGLPAPYDLAEAKSCLEPPEVHFRVDLGLGEASGTAWGSDLTEDYVKLNSEYTT